jgi:hypothetical protein
MQFDRRMIMRVKLCGLGQIVSTFVSQAYRFKRRYDGHRLRRAAMVLAETALGLTEHDRLKGDSRTRMKPVKRFAASLFTTDHKSL